ncbi:MAG: dienelactone hydrolase family protein [Pseudomonadota bacterium]
MTLTAHRKPSTSGTTDTVMVFLHGYGADGADLFGLADAFAPAMPDTVFLAPDAPEPCSVNPLGRQWFPIPHMDGSSAVQAATSMAASTDALSQFLDGVLADEGITPAKLILFGFSQGTMMSLHHAPKRAEPIGAILGFSGRLIAPETWAPEVQSRMPVFLTHGDADPVVPFAEMAAAEAALLKADFTVETHVMPGTPHGIAPDGLQAAFEFLRRNVL